MREIMLPATRDSEAKFRRDFNIIDETHDYIVVDKPPQLLVHPSKPSDAVTLWTELRRLLAFEIANGGQVSVVTRLDRETSGIVLVAKTAAVAREFGERCSPASCCSIGTRCTPRDYKSVKNAIGRARCRRICAIGSNVEIGTPRPIVPRSMKQRGAFLLIASIASVQGVFAGIEHLEYASAATG